MRLWHLLNGARDKRALADLFETVRYECRGYLYPEIDKARIIKNCTTKQTDEYEQWVKKVVLSDSEAKRKGVKKRSKARAAGK